MNDPISSASLQKAAGHRRYLTVLFADLSGSTRIGEQLEAEQFAAMLAKLRAVCREVVARHGGQIARIQSDGVLALFGYDQVREDDGRRAIETALDLNREVARITPEELGATDEPLSLHAGIHAGICFVDHGDLERGRFEVLGDVPNIAARLADLAHPGELCISDETLGPAVDLFTRTERREVDIRGRASRLVVHTIVGHAPRRGRPGIRAARGIVPFVGRNREARSLQARLMSTLAGAPRCALVVGGAGMGKTRLLDELARHAGGLRCTVLRGFCERYPGAEPLQPFLQMLRTLFAPAAGSTADAGTEPSSSGGDAIARQALRPASVLVTSASGADHLAQRTAVDTLRAGFDALASVMPLVIIVDDWQWADDASARVIDAIRALDRPIFLLLATREPDGDSPGTLAVDTLRLEALPLEAVARSVRHLLPGADPFLVADIHRDSGGNPLFVEELCHSAALGAPRKAERLYSGSAWLASLIESRLAMLDPADARLVRIASVIGNVLPRRLLARVADMQVDAGRVQSLADQDFIYPTDEQETLRFKHGITRDVVYAAVGLAERIAIHRAVAGVLSSEADPAHQDDRFEVLAYHYAEGRLPLEAARFAELAGDKAMAAHALDRARLQYVATLSALDQSFVSDRGYLLHWCAVAQKLGLASVFDALALTDVATLLSRAVEYARRSGDLPTIARTEYWLSYLLYAKGRGRAAMRHCRLAQEAARTLGDSRLQAQLDATMGQICASVCRYDEAMTLLDAALDIKRARARPGSQVAVGSAFTLAIKGSVLADRGRFADADACFAEMLELLDGSNHQIVSSVRNWIGVVYLWQGRWADAIATVEASTHVAENVKSRLLMALNRSIWGYATWRLTGTADGLQAVADATQWIASRGGSLGESLNHGWLLDIGETIGTLHDQRQHAARLLRRARQDDRMGEAMGCRALARGHARQRNHAAAARYLELAERSATARGARHEQAVNLLCRAEVALLRDDRPAARQPLEAASRLFEEMDMRWHLGKAGELRWML